MILDPERCYRAAQSRDARFDGWFIVAVRTTGIYCRPSCPALTPKRENVEFYPTAAAAQAHGFRACRRCRPDAAPGSPEWDARGDLVARAMRLLGDGVVDREGVSGLAARLGYSERHLNRLLTEQLGAGPVALARAQRAQTARTLIETTELRLTDIAFAAGFGSVRQFNDTIRAVFAEAPRDMRRHAGRTGAQAAGSVAVRLAARAPFDAVGVLGFLGQRAVPGVETWDGASLARTLVLPHGHGTVTLAADPPTGVRASFRLADWRDLAPAIARVRRLLDLDADPVAVHGVLEPDPALGRLARQRPWLRAAGSVDPEETLMRAILGQWVSVAGARRAAAELVEQHGDPLGVAHPTLTRVFPPLARLSNSSTTPEPVELPVGGIRGLALRSAARGVADGHLVLDPGIDRAAARTQLLAVPGIGPWTAAYVLMRGLGDPDVFLDTDHGVRRALAAADLDPGAASRWRPWRSYAVHHLWASL
ncbi:MAG: AraC family transcriptional regulator [Actinomycetales bacterium]|nr:MAG: AraC family transcriptional regulator [Actinomycetales bacterium]